MNIPELIQRVTACGYRISVDGGSTQLVKARRECALPPQLLATLRANRDAIVEHLTTCGVCGREVSDLETREFVADPLGCDRGGSDRVTDGNGVTHEGGKRCPHKA